MDFKSKKGRPFIKKLFHLREKSDEDGVKETIVCETEEKNNTANGFLANPITENDLGGDEKAQDLMRLVGQAIDEWANLYGMNNLPKKIIFQQALAILNAMNKLFFT